ncbi:MAG: protein kinase [Acidobacteria bacterium]|nr:protein kinase [Acidobacteriota bacterium]
MPLPAGTHLGPYEILALIGAGGMGEVYRASDTRLNRTVAIKVLPAHFSNNPEMRQRFEREAQTIAGLNHPHICTLFDVGRQDGTDFLVMEFLEGETLAQRLERGALPLEEALKAAIEIADALDKAHRQGVVHRDLKPSNVMLTKSGTKLLDFGLAKLKPVDQAPTISALPTRADATAQGTILGTLQYMAPEQLEGKDADARTDIFAFGAVLYEMTTGKKAFEGKSQASLISAIMSAEPQLISKLQPMAPPAFDYVVKRCLTKDPEDRWQTARDVMAQLKWTIEGGTQIGIPAPILAQRRKRDRLAWTLLAIAALLIVAMAIPVFRYLRGPGEPAQVRFQILVPPMPNSVQVTVSPDGRSIAYVASTSTNTTALYIRPLGAVTSQQLAGTEGALHPFWSPDSRHIAFVAGGRLKKIDITGGPPQNLCEAPSFQGGSWNSEGVIVLASNRVLYRVSAAGGQPVAITELDQSRLEAGHFWPFFLPDGRHYLYLAWSPSERGIYTGSLDSKDRSLVLAAESMPFYAEPGYLLYQRQGTLFAQPFDAKRLNVKGDPVRIADEIPNNPANGRAAFAVSQNGVLVYRAGGGTAANSRFFWFDRAGKELQAAGDPAPYGTTFDLSPDGRQVAFARRDAATGANDIWLLDWARNAPTRLTFDPANESDPVWSPDGLRIVFDSARKGNPGIYQKNASGLGEETPVLETAKSEYVDDWSDDGRYIVYHSTEANGSGLYALPLFGDRKPLTLVPPPFTKDEAHTSYDSKWLAYNSNESGTWQIYVISFPNLEQKFQISTNGGVQPRWRKDGKEIYYLALDGKLMAVDFNPAGRIQSGIPRVLFDTGLTPTGNTEQYVATSDGQRFLVLKPLTESTPTPITAVLNWNAALDKK